MASTHIEGGLSPVIALRLECQSPLEIPFKTYPKNNVLPVL
jgi:hypothetical protein